MNVTQFKIKVLPLNSKLLKFAIRFLQDEEKAKDVVQDVYFQLWKKRKNLKNVENIEAYAMRITRNMCIDKSKEKIHNVNEFADQDIVSEEVSENNIESLEAVQVVKKAIECLPEKQRIVIHMHDVKQFNKKEIAKTLDMTSESVRTNLSRARKKIRDYVIKCMDYEYAER